MVNILYCKRAVVRDEAVLVKGVLLGCKPEFF